MRTSDSYLKMKFFETFPKLFINKRNAEMKQSNILTDQRLKRVFSDF